MNTIETTRLFINPSPSTIAILKYRNVLVQTGIVYRCLRPLSEINFTVTIVLPPPKKHKKPKKHYLLSQKNTYWRELRLQVLDLRGHRCQRCTSTKELHIDHIKPKSKYPDLIYDLDNLQVLCRRCNFAKNTKYETDYRHISQYYLGF